MTYFSRWAGGDRGGEVGGRAVRRLRRAGRAAGRAAVSKAVEELEKRRLMSVGGGLSGPVLNYKLDDAPAFGFQSVRDSAGNTSGAIVQSTYNVPNQANSTNSYLAAGLFPGFLTGTNAARGNAWDFQRNGATTHIEIKNNSPTTYGLGDTSSSTGLTIGFWVKSSYNAATDAGDRVLNFAGVFDVWATNTAVGGPGQLGLTLGSSQITRFTSLSSGVLDGNWHHVVISADFGINSNNVRLYVDGAADQVNGVGSRAFTSFANGNDTRNNVINIGTDREGLNRFAGGIDDVVIYNRSVSAAEVMSIYTQGSNAAPNVFAGPNAAVTTGRGYGLAGYATDDGAAAGGTTIGYSWSVVSAPAGATVVFSGASSATSFVTVSVDGTYVLRLTASDAQYSSSSAVTLTATGNVAPVVTASSVLPAVVLASGASTGVVQLSGTVSDPDGGPYGAAIAQWSVVSAPTNASVRFTDARSPNTTATFSAAGSYTLQLTASDGALSGSDRVTVVVYPTGTGGNTVVVNAGGPRSVWMNQPTLQLQGSYWNTSNAVNVAWSVDASSPATGVTFSNAGVLNPVATFAAAGVYVLRLSVTDAVNAAVSGSSTQVVEVYSDAANFGGFSTGALNTYFKPAETDLTYDFTNFNFSRFTTGADGAYAHPRLLVGSNDIASSGGLIERLINPATATTVGKFAIAQIKTTLDSKLNATTATYQGVYNDLAAGTTTSFTALAYGEQANFVGTLAYELFYDLLYWKFNGTQLAAGQKAAAALTSVANVVYANITAANSGDWRNVNSLYLYYNYFAYAYDYGYQFMTAAQQNTVRRALIEGTRNQWSIGLDVVNTYQANTSNWINNNTMYLYMNAAVIDGESWTDGVVTYTPDTTILPRATASLQRLFGGSGSFSDGGTFEGMGKGQIYAESLAAMARRGNYLIAATGTKYQITGLYLASMLPWGNNFTWDEYNGGQVQTSKGNDVSTFKWAFPNDPQVDFVYRADLQQFYYAIQDVSTPNYGYAYTFTELLNRAVFALDYATQGLTIDQAAQQQLGNAPTTFFSNRKGSLWTRSTFGSDAARLFFQPRSEQGGHSIEDRGVFAFDALGRNWVPYVGSNPNFATGSTSGILDTSVAASTVRINGQGSSIVPSKVLDFTNLSDATFLASDLTLPYRYDITQSATGSLIPITYNQTTLYPDYGAWGDLPLGALPDWQFPNYLYQYGSGSGYTGRRLVDNLPVNYAYRTAGLVKGTRPYALFTEDYSSASPGTNTYTWRMNVASGVSVTFSQSPSSPGVYDAYLRDPLRTLLVRFIAPTGTITNPWSTTSVYAGSIQGVGTVVPVLDFTTTSSAAANFKVILFPFLNSDAVGGQAPLTTTLTGNTLTVTTADGQSDTVVYDSSNPDGRTRFTWSRNSEAAISTTPPPSVWGTTSSPAGSSSPVFAFNFDSTPPAFTTSTTVTNVTDNTNRNTGFMRRGSNASSPLPTTGTWTTPSGVTSGFWDFSSSNYYASNAPNTATGFLFFPTNTNLAQLGNTTTTTGFTLGFWMNSDYQNARSDNGRRITTIGDTSATFGATIVDIKTFGSWNKFGYFSVGIGGGSNRDTNFIQFNSASDGTSGSMLYDSQWHHVALSVDFTRTTDNILFYVDGQLNTTRSYAFTSSFNLNTASTSGGIYIGANNSGSSDFEGKLDDYVVYAKPLAFSEIQTLYTRGTSPFAYIAPASPNPASATPFNNVNITFDRTVTGLDRGDFTLTRDGNTVAFTGTNTLTSSNSSTYTFSNLASLTTTPGNYQLLLRAATAGVSGTAATGLLGNTLKQDAVLSWTVTPVISALAAGPVAGNNVRLTWSASGQYTGYRIQRSTTSATSGFTTIATLTGFTPLSFEDNTVSEGRQYYYRVAGLSGSSVGTYTSAISVVTPLSVPTAASSAQVPNQLRARVSWTNNTLGAANVELQRSTDAGVTWGSSVLLPGNAVSYLDTVSAGLAYTYRLRVTSAAFTSAWVSAGTTASIVAPVAPTIVSVAAGASTISSTGTTLVVTATDPGGESTLSYNWSLLGTPPGSASFTGNGLNSGKNSAVTFTAPGTYTVQLTVTNPASLSDARTFSLVVLPVLSMRLVPAAASTPAGKTLSVSAAVVDQFGNDQRLPVSLSASAGSIDSSGLFVPPIAGGPVTLTATAGTYSATTTVSVTGLPSPVAWYKLDETAGTTVTDASGNNITGTASGAVSFGSGAIGGAAVFNTTVNTSGGSIVLGAAAQAPAAPLQISGQITMAAWINPTFSNTYGFGYVVGRAYSTSSPQAETYIRINNNRLEVGSWNGSNQNVSYTLPNNLLNTWFHVIGTYDGTQWKEYINGQFVGSFQTAVGSLSPAGWAKPWRIGSAEFSGSQNNRFFSGSIDDVRIYNTGFSDTDAANLYNLTLAPYITANAAATPTPVTGTTASLSALAADNNLAPLGESGLSYTWGVVSPSPAPVTFSASGSNAAKNATATFAAAGTYTLRLTATDPSGYSATSTTTLTVSPTPTSLSVTPPVQFLSVASAPLAFTASALDQFGQPMAGSPVFTRVSGPGSVSSAGLYTPAGSGTVTLRAALGSLTADRTFTVLPRATFSNFRVEDGSAQRSMVRSLTLTFSQPVSLSASALTLTRSLAGVVSTIPITLANVSSPDGGTTQVISFSALAFPGNSLPDGVYTLALSASAVTDQAGFSLSDGDRTLTFARFFGDTDGNLAVNNTDLLKIRKAWETSSASPAFLWYMDFDGNGTIDSADLAQFSARYGQFLSA